VNSILQNCKFILPNAGIIIDYHTPLQYIQYRDFNKENIMGLFGCISSGGPRGGWGLGGNYLSTGGIIMMIGFLILAGLIIYLIVKNGRGSVNTGQDPMKILQTRFAKGEITKEEYDSIRKELF